MIIGQIKSLLAFRRASLGGGNISDSYYLVVSRLAEGVSESRELRLRLRLDGKR